MGFAINKNIYNAPLGERSRVTYIEIFVYIVQVSSSNKFEMNERQILIQARRIAMRKRLIPVCLRCKLRKIKCSDYRPCWGCRFLPVGSCKQPVPSRLLEDASARCVLPAAAVGIASESARAAGAESSNIKNLIYPAAKHGLAALRIEVTAVHFHSREFAARFETSLTEYLSQQQYRVEYHRATPNLPLLKCFFLRALTSLLAACSMEHGRPSFRPAHPTRTPTGLARGAAGRRPDGRARERGGDPVWRCKPLRGGRGGVGVGGGGGAGGGGSLQGGLGGVGGGAVTPTTSGCAPADARVPSPSPQISAKSPPRARKARAGQLASVYPFRSSRPAGLLLAPARTTALCRGAVPRR